MLTAHEKKRQTRENILRNQIYLGIIRDDIKCIINGDEKIPAYSDDDEDYRSNRILRYVINAIKINNEILKTLKAREK